MEASMENRTVIITVLIYPWAAPNSLLDLFMKSFRTGICTWGLLRHLVIVALDQRAFTRCLLVHTHCFALATEGVDFSEEAYFMGPEYLKMMWTRIVFLRHVLELGYNFVFTDTDIMWFRNPFQHFFDEDFQIACDRYRGNTSDRVHNAPNGGFTFVRDTIPGLNLCGFFTPPIAEADSLAAFVVTLLPQGLAEADVLNKIKNRHYIDRIGLTMRFLSTAHFGGFCEPSKDLNEVCTMHANCCVGLDAKLHDLRILMKDWKHYKSLPMNLTSSASWTVPRKCNLFTIVNALDSVKLARGLALEG
ncbi:hypothetical protein LguiB_025333 [Lonicera macranthoides]